MAQQYSTPGNSSSNFYAPQAASTRKSQNASSSYFGTGGSQPGYQNFGNYGNPSGIGAGNYGIGVNDGPSGFQSGMSGNWQEPGYQSEFTFGSIGTPSPGGFSGGFGSGSIGSPTGAPGDSTLSASQAGMAGMGGSYGGPGGGSPLPYVNIGGQPVQDRQGEFWDNYSQNAQGQYAAQQAQEQYQQQQMAAYQADAQQRQQQQMTAAGYDPTSPLHWSQQMSSGPGQLDPATATQQQITGGQSQLGAAMGSGTGAMPSVQQMAAFGEGPAATGVQAQPQSRYEQMAVNPQRMATLPVSQLQNIANNDTTRTSLRGPIADESARLARMELANRGAGGNQLAVGNQQAPEAYKSPFDPDPLATMDPEQLMRQSMASLRDGGFRGDPYQSDLAGSFGVDNGNQFYNFDQSSLGQGVAPPPGGGGFWQGLGDTAGPLPYQVGPSDVPVGPTGQPIRPQQQGPFGKPQNPFEKIPGYVNAQPQGQPQPAQTGNPIWGQQPQQASNPYPGTTQLMPFGQGLPPGIQGSMAMGPDGKPYGGTPNLSRPEPGTIPGNNFSGYGNDVFQPNPQGNAAANGQGDIISQLAGATSMSDRAMIMANAMRNASPADQERLIRLLNMDRRASANPMSLSHSGYQDRPATQRMGYHPALVSQLLGGNPNYN